MIKDKEKILEAVALGSVKATLATLVWEMGLEQFNHEILDIAAEDVLGRISKLEEPSDVYNAHWQSEMETACQTYLSSDSKPALSILPWLDKVDHQIVAAYAFGGMRHSVLHVVTTVAVVKSRIEKGITLSNLASPGSMQGSLPFFILAKEIKKGKEDKILEKLNIAMGYEVEAMNR